MREPERARRETRMRRNTAELNGLERWAQSLEHAATGNSDNTRGGGQVKRPDCGREEPLRMPLQESDSCQRDLTPC